MRILLVEPDASLAPNLELALRSESFVVYTTGLGEEAIDLGKLYDYDAILLELDLPDCSGLEVIRALRVAKVPTPIIVLSHAEGVENKIRAFGFGADDYVPKPFHRDELVARIHAVVRRSRGQLANTISIGNVVVDIGTQRTTVAGEQMHLTAKEYQMLELLALRQGMVCTKEMFLNHLYGGWDEPEVKIIDVFICKLRKKLRAAGADDILQTVWGRGYTLELSRPSSFVNPSELTAQEAVAA